MLVNIGDSASSLSHTRDKWIEGLVKYFTIRIGGRSSLRLFYFHLEGGGVGWDGDMISYRSDVFQYRYYCWSKFALNFNGKKHSRHKIRARLGKTRDLRPETLW